MSGAQITVELVGGDKYPNIETVQADVLMEFSGCLAAGLHELLALGLLVVENGEIVPAGAAGDLIAVDGLLSKVGSDLVRV